MLKKIGGAFAVPAAIAALIYLALSGRAFGADRNGMDRAAEALAAAKAKCPAADEAPRKPEGEKAGKEEPKRYTVPEAIEQCRKEHMPLVIWLGQEGPTMPGCMTGSKPAEGDEPSPGAFVVLPTGAQWYLRGDAKSYPFCCRVWRLCFPEPGYQAVQAPPARSCVSRG
jgi:hypothetical protein